ncbi:MAG TPA: cysteine--tRNA ligase [Caldisericia bacterium]|nr:cysteine--tRNA ligase [Caldisericia bacterium]HQN49382.1 cysteine--tRNA ligase [Caldisericia bacterium]HQP00307.1 cysteine--tRNA ligase [Caldisericia bacterium]
MIKVYNTLTRKKEEFITREKDKVYMYVCGLTPDNYPHIGHARPLVVYDTMKRYLKYRGYQVKYVQNYTDIDDKIIKRSIEWGLSPKEMAETFIKMYEKYIHQLNIDIEDNLYIKVTDQIKDIIEFIKVLQDKNFAYQTDTGVYFEVKKFNDYGKLSNRKIEDMLSGVRIEVDETKKEPIDFALWKKSKEGEPFWESPWGKGRPGWHIECSVISIKYLGFGFDIHGGGNDLIFPHHENEIAQGEAWKGNKPVVRYWLHNGLVNLNKEKMSKSLGNFLTIEDILKTYEPEVLRLFLLSSDYHSPVDYSDEIMEDIRKQYYKIREFYSMLQTLSKKEEYVSDNSKKLIDSIFNEFLDNMDDDFNTQGAIGVLFKLINRFNTGEIKENYSYLLEKVNDMLNILGIKITFRELENIKEELIKIINDYSFYNSNDENLSELELVKKIIDYRKKLREDKNFKLSDEIRDRLNRLGYEIRDGRKETIFFKRE